MPLESGQVFAGYTIVRLVGSGGMGEVYLAQHPRLPRQDALKVLPASFSADGEFRQRFQREADLAATLWHPHIVGLHDRGEFDGRLWISMDFVDGYDAARLLVDRHPSGMPPTDVVEIVTAVADALDYAHQRLLLHRDIKPANILLTSAERAKRRILLTDFGIARRTDDVNGLTSTNITVGSMSYTAPEQLMGKPMDGRADQYALAATAFRLFTGTLLFPHTNPAVVISHHLNTPPPKLGEKKPELAAFDAVMAKALAKDPEARYDTCHDFAVALAEAGNQKVAEARPVLPVPPPAPPAQPIPAMQKQAAPPYVPPPQQSRPQVTPTPSGPPVISAPPGPPVPPQAGPHARPPLPRSQGQHPAPPVYVSPWTPPRDEPSRAAGFGAPPARPKAPGKRRPLLIAGGIVAVLILIGAGIFGLTRLGGSDPAPSSPPTASDDTSTTSTTRTSTAEPSAPSNARAFTIADYIRENRIDETNIQRTTPGAPVITMPIPPGWSDAGPRRPAWAYSAIIRETPGNPEPPTVTLLVSKLEGDVDAQRLLEYAPNELKNLPGYESGGGRKGQLDGLDSVHVRGTFLRDGLRRDIAQTTALVPSPNGLFVLQINADVAEPQRQVLDEVMGAIDTQTKISR
ncbi:LpqN/LpqT family lipoprotein [Mycobacterium sp. CPCC 205372]|uniref:non-specific serine/threonine protein kinase n=1 Tax=Mycobacterium hippophais TaxID=3016340 RepID=A0ABT4PMI1_9MYCO|nr:LpqN/LpqT family lipoprotein [Mycobacterium hippophais]MCZ8377760.1 LpqN/LpqT family lipoprotein [Mycobacterium hippophais]